MLYLSGCLPSKPEIQEQLIGAGIGLMLTPFSQRNASDRPWKWAADNGCFAAKWDEKTWRSWLEKNENPHEAVFATCPDVVGDHVGTMERWPEYSPIVRDAGYKVAFVLQDGADFLPWDEFDALFIGGTTDFKLSMKARDFVDEAKALDKWVHMGRVNSYKRMLLAKQWNCDSTDGTYLAFGPDVNTPKLINMVNKVHNSAVNISLFEDIAFKEKSH